MTWVDIVAVLLVVVIGWLESVRGFGRAIFDFVGSLIALKISTFLAPPLARSVPLLQNEAQTQAFWMAAIFVVLIVLIVIATKFIYETTLLSLDVLDPVVGALLGIASGIVVAHLFIRTLMVAYADTDFANVLLNSFAGQELVVFRTYSRLVDVLQNLGNW